ncbi:MAG: peptidyl-tRNA hydrolase [Candidatus Parcubacteria bacterium]|jgi:PTH1 family peptidyl-tRNA hydrolase
MHLIVGLGNIGDKYKSTYHNIGFECLDFLTNQSEFSYKKQFLGSIFKQVDTIYLKPHTYMNNSGRSVLAVKQYYNITDNEIIIIHDDSDITLGEYKIQTHRGSGGHHGIDSIFEYISPAVTRIRIGIRAERFIGQKAQEFVLRSISNEDKVILEQVYKSVQENLYTH